MSGWFELPEGLPEPVEAGQVYFHEEGRYVVLPDWYGVSLRWVPMSMVQVTQ